MIRYQARIMYQISKFLWQRFEIELDYEYVIDPNRCMKFEGRSLGKDVLRLDGKIYNTIIYDATMLFKRGTYRDTLWKSDNIFKMIDIMNLYNKETLEIPDNRFCFVNCGGFAVDLAHTIPTIPAIDKLCKYLSNTTTLSVGSSGGLWEYLLQERGCKVICTDIEVPFWRTYTKVIEIDGKKKLFDQIDASADIRILFLGWPEPDRSADEKYLDTGYDFRALEEFNNMHRDSTKRSYDSVQDNNVYVVFISDTSDDRHVGSPKFKALLSTSYKMCETIRLPFNTKANYLPAVEIWQKIN
jgi:hypothetical protein